MSKKAGINPKTIESLFEDHVVQGTKKTFSPAEKAMVLKVISELDRGQRRVAQNIDGEWITNAWLKKAILLYFRISKIVPFKAGCFEYLDKIPLKKFKAADGVRVVPPAVARFGSFVEKGAILMPSYINIGAYVGEQTMVDTWATVGSCAQIGKRVHLSGGVGIGGVLEPAQAQPVVIEDDAFIGSRAIIVEGVHVQQGAVIASGVNLTASTKIIDVTGAREVVHQGFVPAYSVVIPGMRKKDFPVGEYGVSCALIIGQRNSKTDMKTSLNHALRDYEVSV